MNETTDAEWEDAPADEAAPAADDVQPESARPAAEPDAAAAPLEEEEAAHALQTGVDEPWTLEAEPFASERPALLRDLRRIWMGSAFKRSPHVLVLVSVRLARVPGANSPAAAGLLARTHRALRLALGDLGNVHALTPFADAVILSDRTVRRAERIVEAIREAVDARSVAHPQSPMIFAAGIAALHRDDDPTTAVCLAESCLRAAETSPESRVVTETDPEIRMTPRTAYERPR